MNNPQFWLQLLLVVTLIAYVQIQSLEQSQNENVSKLKFESGVFWLQRMCNLHSKVLGDDTRIFFSPQQ